MDLWVRPKVDNGEKVLSALQEFGVTPPNFHAQRFEDPATMLMLGMEPFRIDILTDIPGVSFETAWSPRVTANLQNASGRMASRKQWP